MNIFTWIALIMILIWGYSESLLNDEDNDEGSGE